jgi:hypothetical protein
MALFIAGCGLGGGTQTPIPTPTPTPTPTPANLQAGQWEFVLTPSAPGQLPPFYVEANLTVAGSSVYSSGNNTLLFANQGAVANELPAQACGNVALNATISGTTLSGTVDDASSPASTVPLTLSGATIASNGQSVSGGSYTATSTDCGFLSEGISGTSGTLSGYVVAPVNGTYSGTLNLTGASGSGVLGQLTLQVTQTGLDASATGTLLTAQAVTTNLSTGPTTGTTNATTGALVGLSGTATTLSTTDQFSLMCHVTQDGSQMTVFYLDLVSPLCLLNNSCVFATGTLNKQ